MALCVGRLWRVWRCRLALPHWAFSYFSGGMGTVGDALSHAILPGVAIGYLLSGMSLFAMATGGFIAGIVVALVAGWVSRQTPLKEDASFAGLYLGSLALGVTLVSLHGSSVTCCIFSSARFWRSTGRP